MTRPWISAIAAALLLSGAALVGACAGPRSTLRVHPEKVDGLPLCTSCHDAERSSYNHDARWLKAHGPVAVRDQRGCEICHNAASCADCHGSREELKPSAKRPSRFDPDLPHRGDYLTQHRIDGRLDPVSCFSCHGRKNVGRCRTCHR